MALAPQAGAGSRAAPGAETPVGRTVELMGALKSHRYTAACEVYDPVFWEKVGFFSRDCARILRKTFPRADPVASRVEFGGRVGPRMAVVIVSMALREAALVCDRAWQEAPYCSSASAYYLELTRKTLVVDWCGQQIAAPQSRWYVTSVGVV